jgi:anti-anti-sigma factor
MQRNPRAQLTFAARPGRYGLRVAVSGEIDMAVADQLVDMVIDELPQHDDLIILDFASVTFCDSSGITALIRLRNHQAQAGHTLRIVNASEPVRRVFELAGVVTYLNVDDGPLRPAPTRG